MELLLGGIEEFRGQVKQVWEDLHHETGIFPEDTDLTCILTALDTAHTFSGWVEVADNEATKLSAAFASYAGQVASMVIESVSQVDTIYTMELSYGAGKTIISRWRFAGATKFLNPVHQLRVRGTLIPAGETIYYRMKTASAVADTALVHFRYFLHT